MGKIKRIGVLTSGGDAPGMNAAIRAVVRTAIYNGCEACGIYGGYQGLINGDIKRLRSNDVSNIIQRGGTILKSARSVEFRTPEGRTKAAQQLAEHKIDALVVIGGDGSFTGAKLLIQEHDVPVVGIPGTIDNDLYGTDSTIGYDTAVNTAVDAVDKIKDTASAHNRLFFVEVMGRDAGFIALRTAIATGAEAVLVPEVETDLTDLERFIAKDYDPTKSSGIVIVAEGEKSGGAYKIAEMVGQSHPDYDIRVSVLGHMQRGGSPTCRDRVYATMMGSMAVDLLCAGKSNRVVGFKNGEFCDFDIEEALAMQKNISNYMIEVAGDMSK